MSILRFNIPVKTPSSGMRPSGKKDLGELRNMWEENSDRIRAFAEGLDRDGLGKAVFSHPVSGPMTPGQALAMLEVHLRRHIKQIGDLERLHTHPPA
jgi:hypothetical protein